MYCIFLVDSLLDAHWMCCQAEDYLTALQFLYNGFIRALAAKDLMRCLRLVIVRRIGRSRGGGRGPLATPYFYPPPPLRVWIRYCIVLVVNMNKFYHRLFFFNASRYDNLLEKNSPYFFSQWTMNTSDQSWPGCQMRLVPTSCVRGFKRWLVSLAEFVGTVLWHSIRRAPL